MASTILHEIVEIATNPTFWSWGDARSALIEVAEMCAGQYMNGAQWGPDYKWMYNTGAATG